MTNYNLASISTKSVGVIIHLADGTIQSCNANASRILGYSVEQLIGANSFEPPWQTIHPDGSVFNHEFYPASVSLRTGQPCSNVVMGFYRLSGDLVWLSISTLTLCKANSTEPYGVEVSFIDVTKTISAEVSPAFSLLKIPSPRSSVPRGIANRQQSITLFESEQRLKLATDASGIGMWFWDLLEDELEFTPQCKALFGLSPQEKVSYEMFLNILHPEDRDRTQAAVSEALANQTEYNIEYRVVWSDDSVHWIAAKGRGFYHQNGEPVTMMGTVQDISDRIATAKALQQSKDELKLIIEVIPQQI